MLILEQGDYIALIVVNKTRSCACKLKYLLLWIVNLDFLLLLFPKKKGVGRAMGNEIFYWNGHVN